MEPASISAIVFSLVVTVGVFFRYINKCKCSKGSIEIERDNPDIMYNRQAARQVADQQKFVIDLIEILKDYEPKKGESQFTPTKLNLGNMTSPERGAQEIARTLNLEPKQSRSSKRFMHKLFKTKSPNIPRVDTRKKPREDSPRNNQHPLSDLIPVHFSPRSITPSISESEEITLTNFIAKRNSI